MLKEQQVFLMPPMHLLAPFYFPTMHQCNGERATVFWNAPNAPARSLLLSYYALM
jgi:hypothetical protein